MRTAEKLKGLLILQKFGFFCRQYRAGVQSTTKSKIYSLVVCPLMYCNCWQTRLLWPVTCTIWVGGTLLSCNVCTSVLRALWFVMRLLAPIPAADAQSFINELSLLTPMSCGLNHFVCGKASSHCWHGWLNDKTELRQQEFLQVACSCKDCKEKLGFAQMKPFYSRTYVAWLFRLFKGLSPALVLVCLSVEYSRYCFPEESAFKTAA